MAMAVAMAARPSSPSVVALTRRRANWVLFNPSASYSSSSSSSSTSRKLILYSKPGCCLCDGLKEKLNAAFSLSGQDSLHDIDFQVRDITTNPGWERAYQYEIPVLTRVLSDGTEVVGDTQTLDVEPTTRKYFLDYLLGLESSSSKRK